MKEPAAQTRLLASPPVFYGTWASTLWLGYQWTQHPDAWPLAVGAGFFLAAVMKADEQVRAWKAWKREWDAMAGTPPPPRRWPTYVGMALGVPFTALLFYAGQHGGASAIVGVILVIVGPLLGLGLMLKLIGWLLGLRSAKVMPVTICVSRPLLPLPDMATAYEGLPPHCQQLLRGRT